MEAHGNLFLASLRGDLAAVAGYYWLRNTPALH